MVAVLVWQVCSAVVAGTAGCVGTTLQQEATPPRTALITFPTSTRQVSSESSAVTSDNLCDLLCVVVT